MNKPLVSVVIPTYNRPELLTRAVESALTQTYEKIEIVVVDDGSDIPARKTLSQYNTSVRIITHNENRGGSVARNTGIRCSRGKYIAFLDDDDVWESNKISKQVSKFESCDSEVGLVYCWIRRTDTDGQTILVKNSKNNGKVTTDILLQNFVGSYSSVMVKRQVIDEAGLPDVQFERWQDREWYLRLSHICEFEYVPEILVTQEKQGGNNYQKLKRSKEVFIDKYQQEIENSGRLLERKVKSNLCYEVGSAGVRKGELREARRYLLKSICYNPFNYMSVMFFILSFGDERMIRLIRQLRRSAVDLRN
ncbi:Glycosyl transferase family 2 [Halalkaliarchaeum sp. AArc-CO]|uniref:glycosyltransferase family 2 protein n=1 Tax=Halalkaliarchaeum sp. AArc-CO TaxID=2866381 RepID=UPI00217E85E9|nr:glycosyltransferase family 2 protein [Halalkaliarchaeum sp. AArc-CO]UWG52008.1 Glycosyl transferase family 2 [Halalkaliarchaeum sp. AArc-CO]